MNSESLSGISSSLRVKSEANLIESLEATPLVFLSYLNLEDRSLFELLEAILLTVGFVLY